MWARRCSLFVLASAASLVTSAAHAQHLSGVVRDATDGAPVPAAVVWLADTRDSSLRRTITDEQGRFVLVRPPLARVAHVVRIGFSPAVVQLSADTLTVHLDRLASRLSSIATSGERVCPDDGSGMKGLELWEQARAALLASVVARETRPPRLRLLSHERYIDGATGKSRTRSAGVQDIMADRAYVAGRSPSAFAVYGYLDETPGERTLYAPDDETLLHPSFLEHHCIRARGEDPAHAGLLGIAFEPSAQRVDTIVDVRGVLWIDPVRQALQSLAFEYVGLEPAARSSGGEVRFAQLQNGVQLVSSWSIRIALLAADMSYQSETRRLPPRDLRTNVRQTGTKIVGGEVALARWADGTEWTGSSPHITGTVVDDANRPVKDALVWAANSLDSARTDSLGHFALPPMSPGVHTVYASDAVLGAVGLPRSEPKPLVLNANRNTEAVLELRPRVELLAAVCSGQRYTPGQGIVLGRVVSTLGEPVANAHVELWRRYLTGTVELFREEITGQAGEDGRFVICGTSREEWLRVRASLGNASGERIVDSRADEVMLLQLTLKPAP